MLMTDDQVQGSCEACLGPPAAMPALTGPHLTLLGLHAHMLGRPGQLTDAAIFKALLASV